MPRLSLLSLLGRFQPCLNQRCRLEHLYSAYTVLRNDTMLALNHPGHEKSAALLNLDKWLVAAVAAIKAEDCTRDGDGDETGDGVEWPPANDPPPPPK